jgi:hypothetical protein
MPVPGEMRVVDGRHQMWIPTVSEKEVYVPVKKRTVTVNRNNFSVSANEMFQILEVHGAGEVRECVIVADKPVNIIPKIDGVDVLGGRNRYEEMKMASVHSEMVEAGFYDPNYSVALTRLNFTESAEVTIWFDAPAVVSNLLCVYNLTWQN